MELLSQQQIQQVSTAVQGLNPSQLAWVSGYLSGLSTQSSANPNGLGASQVTTPFDQLTSEKITILYGSQTGNSKRIAQELHIALITSGSNSTLSNLLDYRPAQLKKEQKVVFVISTQGNGEPPDEALSFFKFIQGERAPRLEDLEFAVIGLGDSSYDDFCETGVTLDKRLVSLGATRFIERVDADIDFEEAAAQWQKDILELLKSESTNASPTNFSGSATFTNKVKAQTWSESNPYHAEILGLTNLTDEGSEQEVYHLELAIDDYGQNYQAGDILALLPKNQPELVNAIIEQANLDKTETIIYKGNLITLYGALLSKLEISKLTPLIVKAYAEATRSDALKTLVENKEALRAFINNADLLDLLQTYPGLLSAQQLIDSLRPLISRQYSIASSAELHTDEVHLLVKPLEYEHKHRHHFGAASNWIKQQQIGDTVPVHIKPNSSFKLPANPDDKIIMIGAGTGVAPYRSFLFEREAQAAKGNSWLFFGEQRFKSDFLYQTDWQKLLKNGTLEHMTVAFSRDQEKKIYVQHKLLEEAEAVYQWLEDGASIYVCGDIKRMAAEVHQTLVQIVNEQSDRTVKEAESWLQELQINKRYQRDVY